MTGPHHAVNGVGAELRLRQLWGSIAPAVKARRRGERAWVPMAPRERFQYRAERRSEAHRRLARHELHLSSVTLANVGALPGLATRHDVIVADQYAHNSIEEGMRIAKARGVRTSKFAHNDSTDLERLLTSLQPYRHAVVALDGVYSMSGHLPPLAQFQRIARANGAFLYIDDAHGTGVLGTRGRGTVRDALGNYDNALVVGSLSKAVSCQGGFVAGLQAAIDVLKARQTRSSRRAGTPPYLVATCAALDVINRRSTTACALRSTRMCGGSLPERTGQAAVLGGLVPIVSVLIGEEESTLRAGRFLFDLGYYVQSVVFPAVPHGAGVLRMQVNANHTPEAIEGLLGALGELARAMALPGSDVAVVPFQHPSKSPAAIPA